MSVLILPMRCLKGWSGWPYILRKEIPTGLPKQSLTPLHGLRRPKQLALKKCRESGEIKGKPTTGLGSAANYTQTLGKFLKELNRIKEDGWQDVSREKALSDLEAIKELIES